MSFLLRQQAREFITEGLVSEQFSRSWSRCGCVVCCLIREGCGFPRQPKSFRSKPCEFPEHYMAQNAQNRWSQGRGAIPPMESSNMMSCVPLQSAHVYHNTAFRRQGRVSFFSLGPQMKVRYVFLRAVVDARALSGVTTLSCSFI